MPLLKKELKKLKLRANNLKKNKLNYKKSHLEIQSGFFIVLKSNLDLNQWNLANSFTHSVVTDFGLSNANPNARDHDAAAKTPNALDTPNNTV